MPKNKAIYLLINLLFITCALFCINYSSLFNFNFNLQSALLIILLFLVIHAARFIRMYLILLEDLINPNRFLQLYLKTTLVSTLIPFKIGELYKMYCYGIETGKALTGVVTVIIEKFFDSIVLCLFMIPYLSNQPTINPLFTILLLFVILALILYFTFEGSYRYLNNFLVRRGGGHKTLVLLKLLEGAKKAYDSAKHTLQGRFVALLFLSIIAWGAESILVAILDSNSLNLNPNLVFQYISDGFFGITNILFSHYANLCAIVFIPFFVAIYSKKYFKVFNHQKRSKS